MDLPKIAMPDLNTPGMRMEEKVKLLNEWMYTLEKNIRFVLNNLETDNLGTELADKIKAIRAAENEEEKKTNGGKEPEYYLQPVNLLDNSDFTHPVNQRGITSGQSISAYGYFIDRWRVSGDGLSDLTLSQNGLGLPNGSTIMQSVPDIRDGTVVTFAIGFSSGETFCVSGTINYTDNGEWLRLATGTTDFGILFIDTYAGNVDCVIYCLAETTIQWAALYEGSYTAETLPPYVPKGYTTELLECQRYFVAFPTYGDYVMPFAHGNATGETTARVEVSLPVPMRINTPSVAADGVTWYLRSAGKSVAATVSVLRAIGNKLVLTATVASGLTTYEQTTLAYYGQSGKPLYICFSADF